MGPIDWKCKLAIEWNVESRHVKKKNVVKNIKRFQKINVERKNEKRCDGEQVSTEGASRDRMYSYEHAQEKSHRAQQQKAIMMMMMEMMMVILPFGNAMNVSASFE